MKRTGHQERARGEAAYSDVLQEDPAGAAAGSCRVGRGGSWLDPPAIARVAIRGRIDPGGRVHFLGLLHRPVRFAREQPERVHLRASENCGGEKSKL